MFGDLFSPMHLIIILVIVLLIFGPGKLPDIGAGIGKGIQEFKKAVSQKQLSEDDSLKSIPSEAAQKEKKAGNA